MRICSFNANGLRSAASKGFFDWFAEQDIDLLCVQETKARTEQLQDPMFCPPGYQRFFRDAQSKRGYSGVAIYARQPPDQVLDTLGWEPFDQEGRYIEARFGQLSVVSLYLPSGSSGDERQNFKFEVMNWIRPLFDQWLASGRDYVLCGDWNIVHTERDIKNWKSNQKNSGCLPEERAWLANLLDSGWVDSYRKLRPDGQDYTWWSQRGAARAKDVGWRIDYQIVSPRLAERLSDCAIAAEPKLSDHAPFTVSYVD
ncbi:exodeoxyribonuclease III [Pseudomarimonas arenosa]|uniref:Exodeoxyribonuclease III n=1 Tax=Pseudomarimonas arenosa TaxID=2774145 RepID=A0AAW3ZQ09_9GAMM|nr:exodeoxyribonuclease III [Pseudomarimonas arenosa]MBD8527020.1 exodeoxyribonuclease III [Pseudomarimonas arenosa]